MNCPSASTGSLRPPADFENLVIKTQPNGTLVRLRDVGYAELGGRKLRQQRPGQRGSRPSAIAIYQLPGSNALGRGGERQSCPGGRAEPELPPRLKSGAWVYDTTEFIRVSIKEVFNHPAPGHRGLVILVNFHFLQDWRTTVIPAIAIPVSLIGALGFAFAFGFSLNSLTLFGLILATGLVVDDAIVIVEAITIKISEGLPPRQAAIAVMDEIAGAVVSTSLVLMAVFIPVAFFPGTTGQLYQQFALIIAFLSDRLYLQCPQLQPPAWRPFYCGPRLKSKPMPPLRGAPCGGFLISSIGAWPGFPPAIKMP